MAITSTSKEKREVIVRKNAAMFSLPLLGYTSVMFQLHNSVNPGLSCAQVCRDEKASK